jgi:hypothetical protein
MSCKLCKNLVEIADSNSPYFVKTCASCGRKINFRKNADTKLKLTIEDGEQFVIPSEWLKISANPLKGNGYLTKYGIGWFAELIFIEDLKHTADEIDFIIENNDLYCDDYLKKSQLLNDIDINNPENSENIFEILEKNKASAEWWIFLFGIYNSIVSKAIEENNARKVAWAMRCAERCRAMFVFKENLEEVVWMGHSARRIVEVIKIWQTNKNNAHEEFWQTVFNENPYILSQLFSMPVVFIKDKAYVGGMKVDRQNAKFVDYLYTNDSSNDALLVEIKTPETKLLGKKYRGIHTPSSEITGSVVQVLDYRRELSRNIRSITEGTDHKIDVFNPRCIVIAGNASTELNSELKRKSFELFRTNFKDVEVVTFDELFKKAETLATLFNLIKKK